MIFPQDDCFDWTLAGKLSFSGQGLHTGIDAVLDLSPCEESGYWLWLNARWQKISPEMVTETWLCTRLGGALKDTGLQTVEHLLAALYGLGISAVRIRCSGPEVPILDGSSQPFVDAILGVGIKALHSRRKQFCLQESLHWQWGEVLVNCQPAEGLEIHYQIDYQGPERGLKSQRDFIWSPEAFVHEIAPARTFTFACELESLWANGLAQGGSLDNALVLEPAGYRNTPRFVDEPVRHKILDLLGDLALWGSAIKAQITISKGGHQSHVKLVKMLQEQALRHESNNE